MLTRVELVLIRVKPVLIRVDSCCRVVDTPVLNRLDRKNQCALVKASMNNVKLDIYKKVLQEVCK